MNNADVTVLRGSFGNTISIPVKELVVGDIIEITQGDRVPADCLLLEEMNMTVDQSLYFKYELGCDDPTSCPKETSKLVRFNQ